MQNFEWNLPTRLIYGAGEIKKLGALAKEYGKKVMVVSYGGQPHLQPLIDRAVAIVKEAGMEYVVYDKIEPNPRVSSVDEGVRIFKETGCDVAVAVGGGSVIDATKYIVSVAWSGGSSWDYVVLSYKKAKEYTGAYPLIAVPTVSAAGSEANAGGVITNWETNEKSFSRSPYRIPKAAIIDPEILATLPKRMTLECGCDIFAHLAEHYLSSHDQSEFADRMTEGMMLTVREYLPRAAADGNDLEARGQMALCALFGWSGLQALGRNGTIPMHLFEHQLSGVFDIPHPRGMIIVIPPYLEHFADAKPARFARLARNVFGVTEKDDLKAAKMLSGKVGEWFRELGVFTTLTENKIGADKIEGLIEDTFKMYANDKGIIPGAREMTKDDMRKVLTAAL